MKKLNDIIPNTFEYNLMISRSNIETIIFIKIFILVLIWTLFSFLFYYNYHINNKDCSFDIKDSHESLLIFFLIGNIVFTINFVRLCCLNDTNHNEDNNDIYFNEIMNTNIGAMILYTICGCITTVEFLMSDILKGKTTTCYTDNAELVFRMGVCSFSWISITISFIIILRLFNFFGKFLKNMRIFKFIFQIRDNVYNCEKETQTEIENDIIIPINSYKNEMNIICCIVCMEKQIDILLEPCGHFCICNDCYLKFEKKDCPCCKNKIKNKKAVFISNIYKLSYIKRFLLSYTNEILYKN